jgi:hypothetical protein
MDANENLAQRRKGKEGIQNSREKAQKAQKNLTQSRLRPISPFSYVGQGRKGAKERRNLE